MHGFRFGKRGASRGVIDRRGFAFGQGRAAQSHRWRFVFRMHADERAVLRGLREARKMVASSTIRTFG
jgi:hypothetical protein